MFHPVGAQPPSVYWRRRLIAARLVVLVIVLIALTVKAMGSEQPARRRPARAARPARARHAVRRSPRRPTQPRLDHRRQHPVVQLGRAPPASSTSSAAPCAITRPARSRPSSANRPTRSATSRCSSCRSPTPAARRACRTSPTSQVELRVYNGESRVWGSHDCQIQPGTDDTTLRRAAAGAGRGHLVRADVQPKCAGTRQRVGAGTYTLYAVLAGKTGKAKQFTIS